MYGASHNASDSPHTHTLSQPTHISHNLLSHLHIMAMLTRTGTNPLSFFGGFGGYGDQFLDELEGFGPGYGQCFGLMPFQGQQTLTQPKLAV
jgi:hypothetical protein